MSPFPADNGTDSIYGEDFAYQLDVYYGSLGDRFQLDQYSERADAILEKTVNPNGGATSTVDVLLAPKDATAVLIDPTTGDVALVGDSLGYGNGGGSGSYEGAGSQTGDNVTEFASNQLGREHIQQIASAAQPTVNWSNDGVARILEVIAPYEYKFFVGQKNARRWMKLESGRRADFTMESDAVPVELAFGTNRSQAFTNRNTLVVTVPDDWNDYQVATFIVELIQGKADLPGINLLRFGDRNKPANLFFEFVLSKDGFDVIDQYLERYGNRVHAGLVEVTDAVKEVTLVVTQFAPGAAGPLVLYDLQEGNKFSATFGALTLGGGVLAAVLARGAKGLAIRVADDIIQYFPAEQIRFLNNLPAPQAKALQEALEGVEKSDDQVRILRDFLAKFGRSKPAVGDEARQLLRLAMEKVGRDSSIPATIEVAAHHIIPIKLFDDPLIGARLHGWGIDLNGSVNGVLLPVEDYAGRTAALHRGNHLGKLVTSEGLILPSYTEQVRRRLQFVQSRERAIEVIAEIRQQLLFDPDFKLYNER
jgi:hypothetical protein